MVINDYNNLLADIRKILDEITPEREKEFESAFTAMELQTDEELNFEERIQPNIKMDLDGWSVIQPNRMEVELDGTFSKIDLLRIAVLMVTGDDHNA